MIILAGILGVLGFWALFAGIEKAIPSKAAWCPGCDPVPNLAVIEPQQTRARLCAHCDYELDRLLNTPLRKVR